MLGNAAKPVQLIRYDYTGGSVTTSAYTQLSASLTDHSSELEIFDSSGSTLYLAIGKAGSEQNLIQIVPGGSGRIACLLSKGARLSVKAIDTTASTGELVINIYRR